MADYTAMTDMTLEQAITNGSMVDGENLTINSGAVVTCTQTPSILLGMITINSGEFFVDGLNISSGNVISLVLEWSQDTYVNGAGTYRITGDWYNLGTTDGTNSQVIDLSTYYGGQFECAVNGLWIETGRRITYDNSSGTLPLVDDWIYKTSDLDVMGRIVEVTATYIVVQFLTGTLADNDNIEVRKIVDNSGPDYQISWTAAVNSVSGDIKEAGVYQEFGNCVYNKTSYIADFGHHMNGFVFAHIPEATTLVLGSATGGGFVPPSGCNIRIPNVNVTSSNLTNHPLGTIYNDGGSSGGNRPEVRTTSAGTIVFNTVNFGNAWFLSSAAYSENMQYVAHNTSFGSSVVATDVIIRHNIATADPWGTISPGYYYFNIVDMLQATEISDCLMVLGFSRYASISAITSSDVTIKNNIFTCSKNITNSAAMYRIISCDNIVVDNNVCCANNGTLYGKENLRIFTSHGVEVTRFKFQDNQAGAIGVHGQRSMQIEGCQNVSIIGLELLEGAHPPYHMMFLTDCTDVKIRCFGMIDEKVGWNTGYNAFSIYMGGVCSDVSIARYWVTSAIAHTYGVIRGVNTTRNLTLLNSSSHYTALWDPMSGDNTTYRGLHGGAGTPGGSTGIQDIYNACYGWSIHDGMRSDTVGFIVALMIPETTACSSSITITAGDPIFMRDGSLDMVSGDVVEIEQHYFAKGHTGFPGTYTSAIGDSSWNANEWGNVTVDFQYDTGSGWSGTWLNARTAVNWTGITVSPADGVKLKFRLTATGTQTNMTMFIVDTDTTIAAQKANFYPIDQVSCDVKLNGIVIGSRYWIYDSDTSTELAEGTAAATTVTETVTVPDATNLEIRVRKSSSGTKYIPFVTTAITNTTEINVAIIQTVDGVAT